MIVYIQKGSPMRPAAILLVVLASCLAAGCGGGSPTTPLKTGQEQKSKEQGTKAAPND
jgi:hypothetical protein